jgi:hypothetical protein
VRPCLVALTPTALARTTATLQAAVGAVYEGYTKKVDQLRTGLANAAYSISFQRYVESAGNRSTGHNAFANTAEQLLHMQSVYSIEYLTLLNATQHIIYSVNNDRQGELFDPEGVVTAAATSGVGTGGGGVPVSANGLLTYEDMMLEGPPILRDR